MKQQGTAYLMYIRDYNDYFAPVESGATLWNIRASTGKPYLPRILDPYIPGDLANVSLWPTKNGMPDAWRCPAIAVPAFSVSNPYWYDTNVWLSSTPGAYENPTGWIACGNKAAKKTSVVKKSPSQLFMIEDHLQYGDLAKYPHGDGLSNVCFLDGHVSANKGLIEWWMPVHHGPNVE